jgi:hypothetical protein
MALAVPMTKPTRRRHERLRSDLHSRQLLRPSQGAGSSRFSQVSSVSSTSIGPVRISIVPSTRFGGSPAST